MRPVLNQNPARFAIFALHENFSSILKNFVVVAFTSVHSLPKCDIYVLVMPPRNPKILCHFLSLPSSWCLNAVAPMDGGTTELTCIFTMLYRHHGCDLPSNGCRDALLECICSMYVYLFCNNCIFCGYFDMELTILIPQNSLKGERESKP